MDPSSGNGVTDTFQVDTALETIRSGRWLGKGPGEGTVKRILPDARAASAGTPAEIEALLKSL